MKIVTTSDWRDALAFETPVNVAEMAPGEPAGCAVCGTGSAPLPREELWAVKHRHPNNHAGFVRFYCETHRPAVQTPPPAAAASAAARRAPKAATRPERTSEIRRVPDLDVVRAMCPNCYVEVSATGECGMCGERVA